VNIRRVQTYRTTKNDLPESRPSPARMRADVAQAGNPWPVHKSTSPHDSSTRLDRDVPMRMRVSHAKQGARANENAPSHHMEVRIAGRSRELEISTSGEACGAGFLCLSGPLFIATSETASSGRAANERVGTLGRRTDEAGASLKATGER
jgi:hypothetical protein